MRLNALSRYWHTLRWLRPVQVYGRVWFRLSRPRVNLADAPPVRTPSVGWTRCGRSPSMTGPMRMRFLGVERTMEAAADWNRTDWSKLWLYNAHYFDDLAADGASQRVAWHCRLLRRWIAENAPGKGNGWEPYPSSLRIVNWVKWALAGNALEADAVHSLAVQARYLRGRLEVHLLGNHLWANAKALVFAGAYFAGDEPAAWMRRGAKLLETELDEQLLADGGHFERSPMYHAILLEDMLDLVQLDQVYPGTLPARLVGRIRDRAVPALRWLRVMSHPDGGISFFNDAALGIAPSLATLEAYAAALGIGPFDATLAPLEALSESGYVRLTVGDAVLIADVGPVGPDYLPGHAHADTLSFELSLRGRRVFVNGGTSTYEAGELRARQRGTAMHNTVEVDGQDSSEVWSSFRVARRARPMDVRCVEEGQGLALEASHDGYRRLPGRVIHSRRWELSNQGLAVIDVVTGSLDAAIARFRFAPGLDVEGDTLQVSGTRIEWSSTAAAVRVVPGAWYPRFGEEQSCQVLEWRQAGGLVTMEFSWT